MYCFVTQIILESIWFSDWACYSLLGRLISSPRHCRSCFLLYAVSFICSSLIFLILLLINQSTHQFSEGCQMENLPVVGWFEPTRLMPELHDLIPLTTTANGLIQLPPCFTMWLRPQVLSTLFFCHFSLRTKRQWRHYTTHVPTTPVCLRTCASPTASLREWNVLYDWSKPDTIREDPCDASVTRSLVPRLDIVAFFRYWARLLDQSR